MSRKLFRRSVTGSALVVLAAMLPGVLSSPAHADDSSTITIVGTSDVSDSNLMAAVIKPGFQAAYPGITLNYVPKGTGAAITYAEAGSASALIVHAAALENQFVQQGYSLDADARSSGATSCSSARRAIRLECSVARTTMWSARSRRSPQRVCRARRTSFPAVARLAQVPGARHLGAHEHRDHLHRAAAPTVVARRQAARRETASRRRQAASSQLARRIGTRRPVLRRAQHHGDTCSFSGGGCW